MSQPAAVSADDSIRLVRSDQELGQHQTHCSEFSLCFLRTLVLEEASLEWAN